MMQLLIIVSIFQVIHTFSDRDCVFVSHETVWLPVKSVDSQHRLTMTEMFRPVPVDQAHPDHINENMTTMFIPIKRLFAEPWRMWHP